MSTTLTMMIISHIYIHQIIMLQLKLIKAKCQLVLHFKKSKEQYYLEHVQFL